MTTTPAKLSLSAQQRAHVDNAIIIAGSARSGTSILGQLISTLDPIEYHFEPPSVTVILELLKEQAISKEAAYLLLQSYLHEDLLVESAHGRKVNLRPNDMTLVLNAMPWAELHKRWYTIKGAADAIRYIDERRLRLAIKIVRFPDSVPLICEALPAAQFIVPIRDGRDVIASQLLKGWLTDDALRHNYWPYKDVDGLVVPTLVEDKFAQRWTKMNAATRACYLWRREAQHALDMKASPLASRIHFMFYEDLRRDPQAALDGITRFLSVKRGELTDLTLQTIRPLGNQRTDYDFLETVEPDELEQFRSLNQQWGYHF